ncbi:MAG: hypothetical protein ABWZ53_03730, partial [Actinomycetota bacterium]
SLRQVMQARRPQLAEIGLFLLVVVLPLVFTPFSASPFGDGKLVVLAGGCLALVASGLAADRRIAIAGGALVVATLLAALSGVDPLEGPHGPDHVVGRRADHRGPRRTGRRRTGGPRGPIDRFHRPRERARRCVSRPRS